MPLGCAEPDRPRPAPTRPVGLSWLPTHRPTGLAARARRPCPPPRPPAEPPAVLGAPGLTGLPKPPCVSPVIALCCCYTAWSFPLPDCTGKDDPAEQCVFVISLKSKLLIHFSDKSKRQNGRLKKGGGVVNEGGR